MTSAQCAFGKTMMQRRSLANQPPSVQRDRTASISGKLGKTSLDLELPKSASGSSYALHKRTRCQAVARSLSFTVENSLVAYPTSKRSHTDGCPGAPGK